MVKKRKGRSVRNNKQVTAEPEELVTAPHSFVIHRGLNWGNVDDLTRDFRKVMEPFTATNLKERKRNSLKDFVSVSGVLHVSHMCVFSRTELGMYLKVGKLPRGPTLTFKVHNFSLAKDVISSLKKPLVHSGAFKHSPLLVLNSFSGEGMHLKLIATTFQNMFPTINLTTVNLNDIRRCVLLNYNPTSKLIDFRHYTIKVVPVGISKAVKKVVQGKVPNLGRCDDISQFLTKSGILSESEFEDDPNHKVTLPQKLFSRGNLENNQSAIRLSELGPRLTLQLVKVENGLMDGEVLFHEFVQKSEEEVKAIRKKIEENKRLKESRKRQQELNKQKKEEKKQELNEKSLKGMQKNQIPTDKSEKKLTEKDRLMKKATENNDEEKSEEDDDDVEYYRQEVGEEPDKDTFTSSSKSRKRFLTPKNYRNKRPKLDAKSREKSGERKFDKTKKFKKGNKKPGGRGGHPVYGTKARNREESDFKSKKNSKKVLGNKVTKNKNRRR